MSIALQCPSSDVTAEILRDIQRARSLAEIEAIVEGLQNDDEAIREDNE